jgi:hypothetical protein
VLEKPNLGRLWETFIRFSWDDLSSGGHVGLIREKVGHTITMLKVKGDIGWYCFWIHDKNSGVPTSPDDEYLYFHIRFELKKHVSPVDILPIYCVMTRKVEPEWVKAVAVDDQGTPFDVSLLRDASVEEVWRLIGEQSEWLLHLLDSFKDTATIPASHIRGFLNHFTDMTALPMRRTL